MPSPLRNKLTSELPGQSRRALPDPFGPRRATELNRSRGRASSRWLGGVIVGSAVTGRERPV
jgi:hypothetical protein